MLDIHAVVDYLFKASLIEPDCVIDGSLFVIGTARRNRNLRVEFGEGRGYLIKQPYDPIDNARWTLGQEVAFYRLCQSDPAFEPVTSCIPRLVHVDPARSLFALELLSGHIAPWDFYTKHARSSGDALPWKAGAAIGEAVATVHSTFGGVSDSGDPRLAVFPDAMPWALSLDRPSIELLATISAANRTLLQIIQGSEDLDRHIGSLRSSWRTETLIHADLKSDNILLAPAEESGDDGRVRARLLDWELVQWGDPAWDVGGILQDFLVYWILSFPPLSHSTTGEALERAGRPIGPIQPAVRAFWQAYTSCSGLGPAGRPEFLVRAIRYAGARMTQTAYEVLQNSLDLKQSAVLMLQVSANLFSRPDRARLELFGIFSDA